MAKAKTLRLAAGHHHFDHRVAPWIAQKKGWFAEEGLDEVEVTATGHDGNSLEGLKAGEIDILLDCAPPSMLPVHLSGTPLRFYGSLTNGVNQILIGVPGLTGIEDLKGKRISVVENGTGVDWKPLRIIMRRYGLDPDTDVTLVTRAPFPALSTARVVLDEGRADARMLMFTERAAVEEAGFPILFDFRKDYPLDFPQRLITTTVAWAEENAETLDAFMRAMLRGYRFLKTDANYDAIMEIVAENMPDDPNLGFPPGIPDGFFAGGFWHTPDDARFTTPSLQRGIDEELSEGNIDSPVSAEEITDLGPLDRAAAALDARYGAGKYD